MLGTQKIMSQNNKTVNHQKTNVAMNVWKCKVKKLLETDRKERHGRDKVARCEDWGPSI